MLKDPQDWSIEYKNLGVLEATSLDTTNFRLLLMTNQLNPGHQKGH